MEQLDRIIGQFDQGKKGPLLLLFAAVHGNEKAGYEAINLVMKMLEIEQVKYRDFEFSGQVVGILGNRAAFCQNVRFIDEDLNRIWNSKRVSSILENKSISRNSEETELVEIVDCLQSLIAKYHPSEIVILDLHTTSSSGGIFSIPTDDSRSHFLAEQLHAPVIKNMLSGVSGTLLHYFDTQALERDTAIVTFEAGQHDDPLSVNRCIASIINCMRSIKMVKPEVVENIHDQLLLEHSAGLPKVSRLIYKHAIQAQDNFVMLPGFKNFDPINEGQALAEDRSGVITSPINGLMLMPLYQAKGGEGFFIIIEEK